MSCGLREETAHLTSWPLSLRAMTTGRWSWQVPPSWITLHSFSLSLSSFLPILFHSFPPHSLTPTCVPTHSPRARPHARFLPRPPACTPSRPPAHTSVRPPAYWPTRQRARLPTRASARRTVSTANGNNNNLASPQVNNYRKTLLILYEVHCKVQIKNEKKFKKYDTTN